MSACPRSDSKTTTVVPETQGTYTANPPPIRDETCNVVNQDITQQGSGSTTINNSYQGTELPCILGFKWESTWASGKTYRKQVCQTNPNGSVVEYEGSSWLCIQDHTSSDADKPTIDAPTPPSINGSSFWEPMSKGSTLIDQEKAAADANKSWWDKITDWVKDMDVWDWLKAAAIAGGLIYMGVKLLDNMDKDGDGDGNADKRYNGSAGYSGTYTKPTLRAVLTSFCSYGGITSDVTAIDASEVVEFTLASTTSVRTVLEQLSIAFNFDMVNSGGVLKFIPRTPNVVETINLTDIGFTANSTPAAPFTSKRFQGISLPRKVNITYFSPSLDGNNYTQTAELFTYPQGNELTIGVPITLTDQQARKIAELSLINAHLERMNYKFTTNYNFVHLEPGDCVNSPMGIIRITKVNEAEDGLLQFEACDAGEPSAAVLSNLEYSVPQGSGQIASTVGYSNSIFIDPPWTGTDDTGIRLYASTHGFNKAGWPGAMIYVSRDNGNSYSPLVTVNQETTWGICNAVVPAPVINTTGVDIGWDTTTTIQVTLKTGTLISATDEEVNNGANHVYIGQELIAFGVATLVSDKTYTLSRLKRGLSGTMMFGNQHQGYELVAELKSLIRIPLLDSDYQKTLKFKTVTIGSSIDVADLDEVTVMSNNNKLWQPTNGSAVRQSNGDFVITWTESIRSPDIINNNASTMTQVDKDQTGWGLAIINRTSGAVISTRPAGKKTYTYTVAEQINDFGTAQTAIRTTVVAMHTKYGAGYPLVINS